LVWKAKLDKSEKAFWFICTKPKLRIMYHSTYGLEASMLAPVNHT
jgi:hypothetical protein